MGLNLLKELARLANLWIISDPYRAGRFRVQYSSGGEIFSGTVDGISDWLFRNYGQEILDKIGLYVPSSAYAARARENLSPLRSIQDLGEDLSRQIRRSIDRLEAAIEGIPRVHYDLISEVNFFREMERFEEERKREQEARGWLNTAIRKAVNAYQARTGHAPRIVRLDWINMSVSGKIVGSVRLDDEV